MTITLLKSLSEYTPDSWVIVKIQSEKYGTIHKVIAGWSGSYLYGASWKLSSGIVTFEDKGEHYESLQDSGSTYILYKSSERMSAIMASTFASFEEQLKGINGTIEVIDSGDYREHQYSLQNLSSEK